MHLGKEKLTKQNLQYMLNYFFFQVGYYHPITYLSLLRFCGNTKGYTAMSEWSHLQR